MFSCESSTWFMMSLIAWMKPTMCTLLAILEEPIRLEVAAD